MNNMHQALLLLSLVGGVACQSSKPTSLDLEALDEKPTESPKVVAKPVIDWTQFFKPLPDDKERLILKQQLRVTPEASKPEDLLKRARTFSSLGDYQQAEEHLNRLVSEHPSFVDGHLEMVLVMLESQDTDAAFRFVTVARDLISKQPNPDAQMIMRYRYLLALAYVQRQEYTEASRIFSDLISQTPDFVPAYVALANIYLVQGKMEPARFVLMRGLDRCRDHPSFHYALAQIHLGTLNRAAAREEFHKALVIDSRYVAARLGLGYLLLDGGELDAAEMNIKMARDLMPQRSDVHLAYGLLRLKQGDKSAARLSLEKALDLDPESAKARYHWARFVLEVDKNRDLAQRLFAEVLQAQDSDEQTKSLARQYLD